MSDHQFLTRILLACSRGPVRLFRNNVGVGWTGKAERVTKPTQVPMRPGDVLIRKARPLHAGLAVGSGDLIGWRMREITQADVGKAVAVFASLEAKEGTGRMTAEQKMWRETVLRFGGVAAEVRSVDDAKRALGLFSESDER